MTKITYVIALETAINAVADEEVKEKLTALKAQIEKKASSEKKPTKTQVENERLKAEIVSALTAIDRPLSMKEIMAEVPAVEGLTNQKVTHLVSDLVKASILERSVVKKVPYFAIATA